MASQKPIFVELSSISAAQALIEINTPYKVIRLFQVCEIAYSQPFAANGQLKRTPEKHPLHCGRSFQRPARTGKDDHVQDQAARPEQAAQL
jgi:hypothetical protein